MHMECAWWHSAWKPWDPHSEFGVRTWGSALSPGSGGAAQHCVWQRTREGVAAGEQGWRVLRWQAADGQSEVHPGRRMIRSHHLRRKI